MQSVSQSTSEDASTLKPVGQGHSLRVERKHFTFELKENPRGKFLRITEEVNGRYDAIIVPLTGLEQFRDTLDAIIKQTKAEPPKP